MLLWNTIHFASSFKVEDEHLYVRPKLARVATKVQLPGLWMFAIGIVLLLCYEIHML
jgi:hypothetical protein